MSTDQARGDLTGAFGTHAVEANRRPELGMGYNSFRGELSMVHVAHAQAGGEAAPDAPVATDHVITQIEYVQTHSEVRRILDVRASASYKSVGGNGGSMSFRAYKSIAQTTDSVFLVIRVRVINRTQNLSHPEAESTVLDAVRSSQPLPGEQRAGHVFGLVQADSYVSSITTGGEFVAVFSFNAVTEEDKRKVTVAGNLAVGRAKLSASREEINDSLKSFERTLAFVDRAGASDDLGELSPASLLEYALNFGGKVPDTGGQPIYFTTDRLGSLPGVISLEDLDTAYALEDLESDLAEVQSRLEGVTFAQSHPYFYPDVRRDSLAADLGILNTARIAIERAIQGIEAAPFAAHPSSRPNFSTLPSPPVWPTGALLPLTVTVFGTNPPLSMNTESASGPQDETVYSACVRSIQIDCSALSPKSTLAYETRLQNGNKAADASNGGATDAVRGEWFLCGFRVYIVGPDEHLYSVKYEAQQTNVRDQKVTPFPNSQGNWAGYPPQGYFNVACLTGVQVTISLRENVPITPGAALASSKARLSGVDTAGAYGGFSGRRARQTE